MPNRAPVHRPQGLPRSDIADKAYDRWRGSAYSRGYDARWARVRLQHLKEFPLCTECLAEGNIVAATEVDHVIPIAVAPERRLDPTNLNATCHVHHMAKTQKDKVLYGKRV